MNIDDDVMTAPGLTHARITGLLQHNTKGVRMTTALQALLKQQLAIVPTRGRAAELWRAAAIADASKA
jgi:hypothetical protein